MRINGGQKAVLCVALGAGLLVLGLAARALWWTTPGGGGWFNYAPNNGAIFTVSPTHTEDVLGQAALGLGLIIVWTVACLALLRTRQGEPGDVPSDRT